MTSLLGQKLDMAEIFTSLYTGKFIFIERHEKNYVIGYASLSNNTRYLPLIDMFCMEREKNTNRVAQSSPNHI